MIKTFKYITLINILFTTLVTFGQANTSTPYSEFGLGDLKSSTFQQGRAMGGISMGLRKSGAYNMINVGNPASYSSIILTAFDIGINANAQQLNRTNFSAENSFNVGLSHLAFAMPVSKKSALSFGLLPYSEMGYNYTKMLPKSNLDGSISTYNKISAGDGSVSKVYLGYGYLITPNLSLGVNLAYLTGSLKKYNSEELPEDPQFLNSRVQTTTSIGIPSVDYGVQYTIANPGSKAKIIIGYTGNWVGEINTTTIKTTSLYRKDYITDNESESVNTPYSPEEEPTTWNVPMTHTLGFAYEKFNKLLLGADVSYSHWSNFREGNVNSELSDRYSIAAGGQITPDINALTSYFKLVDYRFGVKYDKTFITINNQNIHQYAITFGLGLPLRPNRLALHKINFSTEIGKRGTTNNNLISENYINFSLGFTMNDKWFIKSKFD